MRVKFKSKEAYEKYNNFGFTINEAFCELISFDEEFIVSSLDDDISVEEFCTINGNKLWDLDPEFFNYRYNSLFRYSNEIELLEEVKEETSLKLRFKSHSDRINYASNFRINKKISSAIGNSVFEIPGSKLHKKTLVQDIKIKGMPIYKLCGDLFNDEDLTTTAFLKSEFDYLVEVDEDKPEPIQTTELLKSVRITLDGEYNKSELIDLRDKLNRLIEEF